MEGERRARRHEEEDEEGLGVERWTVTVRAPRPERRERYYSLRVRGPGGVCEQRSTLLETREAAELEAERTRADLAAGLPASSAWTLAAVCEARALSFESTGKAREARAVRTAAKKVAPHLGELTAKTLDRAALLRALDALRAEGTSAGNLKTVTNRVAAAWRWAESRGYVTTPWPRVRVAAGRGSRKRPYSGSEVEAVLSWVASYAGGRWLGLFSLLADTGRRSGELVRLRGRDVLRQELAVLVRQKGDGEGTAYPVPVPAETMALLPEVAPDAFVFPCRDRRGGVELGARHVRTESVLLVLRKALAALEVPDAARLDVHSFRRAFVSAAERAGIPTDVGRRVTGHKTRAMWDRYQAATVGDDLRAVVDRVRSSRSSGSAPQPAPQAPPKTARRRPRTAPQPPAREEPREGFEPSTCALRNGKQGDREALPDNGLEPSPWGADRSRSSSIAGGYVLRAGGLDLEELVVVRWAEVDPRAMLRLLRDEELRAALLGELRELLGEDEEREARRG